MIHRLSSLLAGLTLFFTVTLWAQQSNKPLRLEQMAWTDAERVLNDSTIVVIPLGSALKEHGPHLQLQNDWLIAEYCKQRLPALQNVVITPTVNYHYYPAFTEYPGSTTLRLQTARDLIIDICLSFAKFGVRRFYVLNTGVSTNRALKPAAETLALNGILLHYTDLLVALAPAEKLVAKQQGGTHADEIETSMMLVIAPQSVAMVKAVKDISPSKGTGGLTRDPNGEGVYSRTGIFGDATLATREKGALVLDSLMVRIHDDIQTLRRTSLPQTPSLSDIQQHYAGVYSTAIGDSVSIEARAQKLWLKRKGLPELELWQEQPTRFFTRHGHYKGGDGIVTFFEESPGNILLHLQLATMDIFARKQR